MTSSGIISWPPVDRSDRDLTVTAYQAKVALDDAGLYGFFENLINHPDTPMKIKLAWQANLDIRRDNPLLAFVVESSELTEEQVDSLFAAARLVDPNQI